MNCLVLGASGLIGSAICRELSGTGQVFGTYCSHKPGLSIPLLKFDVSGEDLTDALEQTNPDVIVSCLRGEFDSQLRVHEQAARWAEKNHARIVFLSTANVFDGAPGSPHTEQDRPEAISAYGRYKIACEAMLIETLGVRAVIVRLPLVFDSERLHRLVQSNVADDGVLYINFFRSVNTASAVAAAIRFIIENNSAGIVHLGSSDSIRDNDFIKIAAEKLGLSAVGFTEDYFTDETYCSALGCDSTDDLATKGNGNFYQVLNTVRSDLPKAFYASCREALESVIL